ncbi:MAG: DUF551 domain-containing protein, partial [Gammaproteobacteria bacterium]
RTPMTLTLMLGLILFARSTPAWRKMMSDMPDRIWAQRGMDGGVWSEPLDSFELYTEYIRADKFAEPGEQDRRLVEGADDWISVDERLPEDGLMIVVGWAGHNDIWCGPADSDVFDHHEGVTHWKPITPPESIKKKADG